MSAIIEEFVEQSPAVDDDENYACSFKNVTNHKCLKWAESIYKSFDEQYIAPLKNCDSETLNFHHLEKFADRLLLECGTFPIWSCVIQKDFGFGRKPATSAHCESFFNNIKNRDMQDLPLRADTFVACHVELLNLNGTMKIRAAKQMNDEEHVEDKSDDIYTGIK